MKKYFLPFILIPLFAFMQVVQAQTSILPSTTASSPSNTISVNVNGTENLFFTATNATNGTELWRSDGTTAGTVMVKDINPGTANSLPLYLTNVDGIVYFRANDGTNGIELWRSNGTAAGTYMVKDIRPGTTSTAIANLYNLNGVLYFSANDGTNGLELWKSNGTSAGTVMVKDIEPGSASSTFAYFTTVNNKLIFQANEASTGNELWISDGTSAGTFMLKDIWPGSAGSGPRDMTNINGIIYFHGYDPYGTGAELWRSDGTIAGTYMIKDIWPGNNGFVGYDSQPLNFTNFNNLCYFAAEDGINGRELWKSDGTAAGTVMVKDINSGGNSSPNNLIVINGVLYFRSNNGTDGNELWKSDGTTAGTVLVKDINPGSTNSSISNVTNVDNVLYFTATTANNGAELWKSDGTTAGTVLVADLNPGTASSSPTNLVNLNNVLYFSATNGSGIGLWNALSSCTTPTTYTVTGTGSYCTGGAAVGLSNSETGVTYQLNGVGTPVNGTTGSAISFGNQTAGTYTVVATRTTGGCTANMSGSAVVTENTLPTAYPLAGGTGVAISIPNAQTGVNYQLKNGATNVGSAMPGTTGMPVSFGVQTTAGTYTVVATTATGGCTAQMTGSVVITVPVNKVWTGTSTVWENASSWSPAGVPAAIDNVTITLQPFPFQYPTITSAVVRAGTTTLINPDGYAGAMILEAGGSLTNSGIFTSAMQINMRPGSSFTNTSIGTMLINYTLTIDGTSSLLTNNGTITFGHFTGVSNTIISGGVNAEEGNIINIGTINIGIESYIITNGGTCTNTGTILNNGTFYNGGTLNNTGGVFTNNNIYSSVEYRSSTHSTLFNNPVGSTIGDGSHTGCITFSNGLTTAGTMNFVLGQGNPCEDHNKITVVGTATLGGTFKAKLRNTTIAIGDTYTIMTYTSRVGAFTNTTVDVLDFDGTAPTGYIATISYTATEAILTISGPDPVPISNACITGTVMLGFEDIFYDRNAYRSANGFYGINYTTNYIPGVGTWILYTYSGGVSTIIYHIVSNAMLPPTGTSWISDAPASCAGVLQVGVPSCTVFPTAFPVTGTTTYCLDGIGKPVGLSGSELGVNYQMRYNGGNTPFGAVVAGTGGAISFGNQMFGATYTVVATNAAGCTALMTGNAILTLGAIPPAHIAGSTVACNTVSLTAYGGTTYTWSGGTTPNTAANTFATSGIYTVTVATADGCSATATRNITVNPLPNAAIAMVNNCNSTTLTASGGATYTWSGGSAPTAAINTISATGTYNVTVSNANGCSTTASQVVTMPNVTEVVFGALSGCGSTVLTANNIAGATYAWSGGNTPNAATNTVTATGTYTVTITSNGCTLSTTRSVVVHPLPTASITSASPTCNNGASVLTAAGGTSYTWSAGHSTTTATNTVNGSGSYTVTVTSANGCSSTTAFVVNAVPSPLISGHTTSCGTVSLKAYYANNPSGGTYAWSGGSTPNTDANAFTTSGIYTVTATSTASCAATASVTITINPAPTVSIAGNAVSCGNAVLTASGGVSYRWSNGLSPNAASNTVTNVANYTVTVTNANGCTATTSFAVTAINAAVNPTVTGNATGCTSTTLTAGGGNTYAWSGGSAPTSNINTFTTSGTYTVTITRSNGCSATALRAISVGGTVMPMITTSNNPTCTGLTLTTNGGSSYAWSGGGVAATKAVATSGTYTVTVTTATCGTGTASITVSTTAPTVTIAVPATNCNSATLTANSTSTGSFSWSNSETNATNTVLNAQIYTVTMTADNKCTATASKVVTISNVQANISGVNSACGTLTLTASGGTSYAWSGSGTTAAKTITTSGTYTVTATTGTCTATASKIVTIYANPTATIASSAVSCGVATLTATPTPAGTYTYTWPVGRNTVTTATNTVAIGGIYNVTVTDANGCTGATSFNLTLPNTSVGISGVTSGCGSVSLTAYGNGNASTYAWSGGGTGVVKAITTSGTYTVTITTGTCTATASQTVTINPAATATITSNTTACNSLSLTASGGAYYAWSGGTAPTAAINTAIVTGTYTVTVTNSAGCTASTTRAVTINTLPTAGIIGTTTACGQVALVAIGNTGSSYTWSGGSTPSVAANTFTASGVYTVTVTQGVCGTATASRTVTINTAPTPSITGSSTGLGTVTLTASGGTYYAWNSGYSPTTAVNTGFLTNTYIVTVTNTNGCTATASKAVTITYSLPAPPVVAANTAQASHSPTAIDTEAYNTVLVYPNPIAAGDLAIKINLISDAITANIAILDIYGKVISTQTVTLQRGENTLALPLDNLAAGIYFISITAQGQRFETKRVVKVE
jgi:ELWxxDGT repeat protein